ncbi:MAG: hypothetical protein DCC55_26620 [Chloroflexi bacterium]|nr:MAG: hypothetical protein DCC55_26620 [Chloroflexota bacterium]
MLALLRPVENTVVDRLYPYMGTEIGPIGYASIRDNRLGRNAKASPLWPKVRLEIAEQGCQMACDLTR